MQKTAVLVAGMHRSGTSALTRVLNIVGCDPPRTLMRPQRDNVTGFWESQSVMEFNQEILASAGSSWDDWRPFDRDWYTSPVVGEFRERVQTLLQEEYDGSRLFVLKDPRICRLLEFWVEAVEAFGARPIFIMPIRSPVDVASSLHTRDDIDPSVGHLMWLRHVLDAEASSRGLARAWSRYEQLLSGPQALIERLGDELGVSWPKRLSLRAEMEIEEFLSPELRHHESRDASLLENPRLSIWIRASFEIFDRWTRGDVRKEDSSDLDRIKAAFDEATPAFSRAIVAARQGVLKSRARLKELEHEATERDGRIEALRAEATERDGRIEALRAEATERDGRIEALRAEATERDGRIEALRAEATERDGRIEALCAEVAERDGRIEALRAEVAERDGRIEALRAQATERDGWIEALCAEVAERDGRIEALCAEVAERDGRIEALCAEVAERDGRIEALTREIGAVRRGHLMALARRRTRLGIDRLEASILLNPDWLDRFRQRHGREPGLELRRNGRVLAHAFAGNAVSGALRIPIGLRFPAIHDTLYSIHDASTGDALAARVAPAWLKARRVEGAVESRARLEVRGWLLDRGDPARKRRAALQVNGSLHDVIIAEERRADIARWKGTDGHHGFLWRIPEAVAAADGVRIDVFDADSGRPLRGSPIRVESDRVVASGRSGA